MQDFPANSAKAARAQQQAPPEPKRIERVTSAEPERRRGLGRKFKDIFISGSARDTADYMVRDVIVPELQDMVVNSIKGGIDKLVYGEVRRRSTGQPNVNAGRFDYRGISSNTVAKTDPNPRPTGAPRQRGASGGSRFDDIVIADRMEATDVIDQMFEIRSRYGSVSVADLYSMVGIQAAHTDVTWGWVDLTGSRAIKQRNGGYLLALPRPQPLQVR